MLRHGIMLGSLMLALVGCSGGSARDASDGPVNAGELTESERTAVLVQLEAYGIKSTSARFAGDKVIVGGDLEFPLSDLLAQSEKSVEKGYATGQIAFGTMDTSNLRLAFSASLPPSENWKTASRGAAANWSHAASGGQNADLNIDEANTGNIILVGAFDWTNTPPFLYGPCVYAVSTFPSGFPNGHPGSVTINKGFNCGSCPTYNNLSPGVMQTVMRHELGHTLGMVHPEDRNADDVIHIGDTATGQTYSTVMHATTDCFIYNSLQSDDKKSAVELFGAAP